MHALLYLIPIALTLGLAGLVAFLWAMKNNQFEDLDGAAYRILREDDEVTVALDARQGTKNAEPVDAPH